MPITPKLYHFLRTSDASFKGRGKLSKWAQSRLNDGSGFFKWRMKDGHYVAIRPSEAEIDFGVAAVCFLEGAWESHISAFMGKILKSGDRVIDVGANIGSFSCRMSSLVGAKGRVFAYEPSRSTFQQLCASIKYNRFENIVARNIALGETRGMLTLRVPVNVSGNASAYMRRDQGEVVNETVEMSTLDQEVVAQGIESPALIKLDAEGSELGILKGARTVLETFRPGILVEWNPETAALAGWNLQDLISFVYSCGDYRAFLVWRDGQLVEIDPTTIKVQPGGYIDLYFALA